MSTPLPDPAPPYSDTVRFGAALAELVLSIQADHLDPDGRLEAITAEAVRRIPGAAAAALVVQTAPGRLTARAEYGPLSASVVNLQNEVGEGPCLEAMARSEQVRVADLTDDDRWPLLAKRSSALGVGGVLCTPIAVGTGAPASLSLMSTVPGAFDVEAGGLAAVFAAHASIALREVQNRTDLVAAVSTRDVIGQAKGVLMERHQVSADEAFAMLVRASQHTNTKLRIMAERVCLTQAGQLES